MDNYKAAAERSDEAERLLTPPFKRVIVTPSRNPSHTPNGYDPRWVGAINDALESRENGAQIEDVTDEMWDSFLGPLLDAIEDGKNGAGFGSPAKVGSKVKGKSGKGVKA